MVKRAPWPPWVVCGRGGPGSDIHAVIDHRQKADRHFDKALRTVGHGALEGEGITRFKQIKIAPVPVFKRPSRMYMNSAPGCMNVGKTSEASSMEMWKGSICLCGP